MTIKFKLPGVCDIIQISNPGLAVDRKDLGVNSTKHVDDEQKNV